MIKIIKMGSKGDWKDTLKFLIGASKFSVDDVLHYYGQEGVNALSGNTPVDTGLTASSWSYKVIKGRDKYELVWTNSNVNKGTPIALLIQYGHGTRGGGYVTGTDYINPAVKDILQSIADRAWREVTQR